MAETALNAIEYWLKHLPRTDLQRHYDTMLPALEGYLKTVDFGSDELVEDQLATPSSRVQTKRRKRRGEVEIFSEETPFMLVRQRIVILLGSISDQAAYLADISVARWYWL